MDPDELLAAMLVNAARITEINDHADEDEGISDAERNEILDTATELAEQVTNLHAWITSGGFLPAAWQSTP